MMHVATRFGTPVAQGTPHLPQLSTLLVVSPQSGLPHTPSSHCCEPQLWHAMPFFPHDVTVCVSTHVPAAQHPEQLPGPHEPSSPASGLLPPSPELPSGPSVVASAPASPSVTL
jgi:hypothetical protein